jgi:hypothetical protein
MYKIVLMKEYEKKPDIDRLMEVNRIYRALSGKSDEEVQSILDRNIEKGSFWDKIFYSWSVQRQITVEAAQKVLQERKKYGKLQ